MDTGEFLIRKRAIIRKVKEINILRGGVQRYAAPARPRIDAEIAELGRLPGRNKRVGSIEIGIAKKWHLDRRSLTSTAFQSAMSPGCTRKPGCRAASMATMLSHMGGRGCQVREDQAGYGNGGIDFDPDSDFDLDKEHPQPSVPGDACQRA